MTLAAGGEAQVGNGWLARFLAAPRQARNAADNFTTT